MDPLTLLLLSGCIGGLILALILFRIRRSEPSHDVFRDRRTDVINAARIRVAGVGGLGLVAMAATVALVMPRIRTTLAIGCALGLLFAVALILRRQRTGGLPSSGRSAGANTTLSIDALPPAPDDSSRSDHPVRELVDLPASTSR